jgi:hypothetical protein
VLLKNRSVLINVARIVYECQFIKMWHYQAQDYCRCISSIFTANEINTFFPEVGTPQRVKLVESKYFTNQRYKHGL